MTTRRRLRRRTRPLLLRLIRARFCCSAVVALPWIGWSERRWPRSSGSLQSVEREARRGRTSNAHRHTETRTHTQHTHTDLRLTVERCGGEGSRQDFTLCFSLSVCVSVGTCALLFFFCCRETPRVFEAAGNSGAPLRRNASGFERGTLVLDGDARASSPLN